jgi:gamma-glutamyl-gamma-aminobutyrate hydrolase PuuD
MAGELKQGSLQSIKQSNELSVFKAASKPFKSAAIAAVASTAGGSPDGVTPRKYIKVLHQCVRTLDKHRNQLPAEVVKALKVRKQPQSSICRGQQVCCTVVAAGG